MRRSIGLVLVGLGVLMLALAPLLRWYAYPRLAVVSDDVVERVSSGQDVVVLDRAALLNGSGTVERSTDIHSVRKVVPDSDAGTDDDAVVETSVTTVDVNGDGEATEDNVLSYVQERMAFDRHTGRAIDGHGQYVSHTGDEADAEPVEHSGHLLKLPFGTEKRDYEFWDTEVRDTRPMVFDGVDERDGLEVYRFVQRIEPTPVEQLEVPGALFDRRGAVTAERVYANTRTIWVEPRTGVIIDGREEQDSFLRFDGERGPAIVAGTVGYTDDQVADNVAEYGDVARELTLVRDTGPLAGAAGGAVLVVAGLLLARRTYTGRRAAAAPTAAPTEPPAAATAVATTPPVEPSPVEPPPVEPPPVERPPVEPPVEPPPTEPPPLRPPPVEPPPEEPPEPTEPPPLRPPPAEPPPLEPPIEPPTEPAPAGSGPARREIDGAVPARPSPALHGTHDRHDADDEFDEFDEDGQSAGQAYRY